MSEEWPTEIEDCEVLRESDDAIEVSFIEADGSVGCAWVPKSQICDESEVWETGDSGILVIPEWLAEEKGMV